MLTNEEVVVLVRQEIDSALGYDSDTLSVKREAALNYYNGIMPAPPEGRSAIVSMDVADTVHSLLSQVGRIFQTSMLSFAPESEQDESQAQLESDAVSWQFEQSNGYKLLNESAHDALLIGNGWLKVEVVDDVSVTTEDYGPMDELQLFHLMEPTAPVQSVEVKEVEDGYKITRTTTTNRLVVDCIAPELMLFSHSSNQFDLDDLRFVGERKLYTASELKDLDVSEDDIASIPNYVEDYSPAAVARDGIYQDDVTGQEAKQDAEVLKECFDVYMRIDMNGDGSSELFNIIMGGNVLIYKESADCIPYATGSPVPMPHRTQGKGMFELMGSVQRAKTDVLRSYVDNLEVMNSSRIGAVEGDVNMSDLTNGRINGVVRMKTPNGIVPFPVTDAGQQAVMGLNYLDTVRSQRGGASVDNNDADRQLMMSSATAAAGAQESAERMAGWYARNLTQSLLRATYKLIHKKLRKEYRGTISAKLRGQWQQVSPSQWAERNHIEMVTGMTTSERNQRIAGLTTVVSSLTQMLQSGGEGVITDKSKLYSAMDDWLRASELGEASDYLIDPTSEQARQAMDQKGQAAQQEAQQLDRLAQMEQQIEQQKLELDRYKHDSELKFKYYDTNLDAEVSEAKIVADGITKLQPKQVANQ